MAQLQRLIFEEKPSFLPEEQLWATMDGKTVRISIRGSMIIESVPPSTKGPHIIVFYFRQVYSGDQMGPVLTGIIHPYRRPTEKPVAWYLEDELSAKDMTSLASQCKSTAA